MQPLKRDTTAVGYNAAYTSKEPRFSLAAAIALHARLEAACDEVIQKQDDLIRAVTTRCRDALAAAPRTVGYVPLVSSDVFPEVGGWPGPGKCMARDAFAPMVSQEFILQASEEETEGIESFESDIIGLRQCMRKVEDEIVMHTPLTPSDVAGKVRFLSGLLSDGGEVDIEAFARLAETSAEMLLEALGEVWIL